MDKNSHSLIHKIQKGDVEAFKELYNLYYASLCRHANSFVHNFVIAEDIVQDIFFNLWMRRKSLIIEYGIRAYLYRTVYYQAMKFLRDNKTAKNQNPGIDHRLVEAEMLYRHYESPFSKLHQKELKKELKSAIDHLPDKSRKIFILSRKHSMKNQEIADHLNVSVKTVEYHITKALVYLRNWLNNM